MKRANVFKKSLATVLAVTLAVLGGCGKNASVESPEVIENPAEESASTESTPVESTESTTEDDLYGEEVTINVMAWDRGSAAPGTTIEDNAMTQWIQENLVEDDGTTYS